ncbi:MAG: chloride channel protein [Oscillibacter sp.]|nr:chloride channel protein [Oscillibacter sp.]
MDTKAIRTALRRWGLYVRTFIKWTAAAAVIGAACGLVGTPFHFGVHEVTAFRGTHPWVLYLLPLAGLVIVGFYKLTGTDGLGTDDIIDAVHQGKLLPILLLPAIFFGTILTHLCGGSAGREGAALQMGGTIGQYLGRHFQLDDRDLRVATLAGMAAFFSALFGTPLAATVFAIMVISIGVIYHVALYPSLLAALVAYGVSIHLGVEPTRFAVSVPEQTVGMFVRVALLGVLCALVSILFCQVMHGAGHLMKRIRNPWLRVVCGGAAIIVLTLIFGTDYNGAGMEIVTAAVEQGTVAVPWAFLLKLIFTAITLATGFKGGEVVPSFFVGATFGCTAAPLLGLPAGFGAAVGLAAVFCGVTNCPLASTLLAVELFGAEGLLYFALACCLSYMLSGYQGLYSSQTILYSKLKAQFINVHTNAHHAGEKTE